MTKKLRYQRRVYSKETALEHFIESGFVDCSINAFPSLKEGATWRPEFLFIDLDLSNFNSNKKSLEIALNKILKNIKEKLANNNAHPTVLWSRNGYHIILPVYCPIELERIQEFQEFDNPSERFLRLPKIIFRMVKQTNHIIHHLGLVFYVYRITLMQNVFPEEKASKTQR
jgi:hypothetical protein